MQPRPKTTDLSSAETERKYMSTHVKEKPLTQTQKARAAAIVRDLFTEVEDYADNADCGDGGDGPACKVGECWHCRAVAIVSHVRAGKPLKFTS